MAYNFNGTNQTLSFNPTITPAITGYPLTMACWFRTTNLTTDQLLIMLSNASGSHYFTLAFNGPTAGDPISVAASAGTPASVGSTTGVLANTWYHACGVFASATSRTVYLNGGSSATSTTSVAPTGITNGNFGSFLSAFVFLPGQMANVGIWNAALTQDEVISLVRGVACSKIRPQSLNLYAPLIRNLQDTKNGRSITNVNGATVADHPRIYS